MDWQRLINEEKMIERRHWLHMHPEVAFHEYKTSRYIEEALREMNIEIIRPTQTSVVGIIRGKKQGKTVALRADIDALPITEEADVAYKSLNEGVMHACGHDAHAAMLLAAAEVLSQITEEIEGSVKLVFQHAEELSPGGAKQIMDTGCLNDVSMFYGSHIMTPFEKGKVSIGTGPMMAAQNLFEITIQGKGAHGSMPQEAIDSITVGSSVIMNLNTIVSRNIDAFDTAVISYGEFSSGSVFNVIPDTAFISGTVRTHSAKTRAFIEKRIKEVVGCTCEAFGAEYEINYVDGYPPLVNDEIPAKIAEEVASAMLGKENIMPARKIMASEDFAYYGEIAPSVFVFIGGGDEKDGCKFGGHHPKFTVADDAMLTGAKMYVGFALEALGGL